MMGHPKAFRDLAASDWSVRLAIGLDAIAMLALWGTGDVHLAVFVAAFSLAISSRLSWLRLTTLTMTTAMVFTVLTGAAAILLFQVPAVVAAAHAAPVAHALLWLSDRPRALVAWRIGFGFVELILASALTTEFYLFLLLVAFTLVSTLALSCLFLAAEQGSTGQEPRSTPIPKRYLRQTLNNSVVLFVASMMIFPLLPRVDTSGNFRWNQAQTGYTEQVTLGSWKPINGQGEGAPMLRIFSSEPVDLTRLFYNGLIRGRVLDQFDGDTWSPSPLRPSYVVGRRFDEKALTGLRLPKETVKIEVVREPMETNSLPIPYAVERVRLTSEEPVDLSPSWRGEYSGGRLYNRRVHYEVSFHPSIRFLNSAIEKDPPLNTHVLVPTKLRTDRLEKLNRRILGSVSSTADKVKALRDFLRDENFKTLENGQTDLTDEATVNNSLHPIENFLFVRKAGHCELYASSTALLLRMSGVPSRLVAGFRISRSAVGGVLTVRAGDAHAWVEYFDPRFGWTAFDPTPRLYSEGTWIDQFRIGYEVLSSYWYKYILSYGEGGAAVYFADFKRWAKDLPARRAEFKKAVSQLDDELVGPMTALLVLSLSFATLLFLRRRSRIEQFGDWNGPRELKRLRVRMQRHLNKRRKEGLATPEAFVNRWTTAYAEARFREDLPPARRDALLKELHSLSRGQYDHDRAS